MGLLKFGVFESWMLCGIIDQNISLLKCCWIIVLIFCVRLVCELSMVSMMFSILSWGLRLFCMCFIVFISLVRFFRVQYLVCIGISRVFIVVSMFIVSGFRLGGVLISIRLQFCMFVSSCVRVLGLLVSFMFVFVRLGVVGSMFRFFCVVLRVKLVLWVGLFSVLYNFCLVLCCFSLLVVLFCGFMFIISIWWFLVVRQVFRLMVVVVLFILFF